MHCSVVFGVTLRLLVINISSSSPAVNNAAYYQRCVNLRDGGHPPATAFTTPACCSVNTGSQARYRLRIAIFVLCSCNLTPNFLPFGVRLQEHRTEVESKTGRTFTRSLRASSLTEHNKSALTDHATQENHVINWSQAMVIHREPERFTRWIKEAIHIRK